MANDVILNNYLDENLRPIKIGGEISALEIASQSNGARITGDLELTGKVPELTVDRLITNFIESTAGETINLKSTGRKITFSSDEHTLLEFNPHSAEIKLMSQDDNTDYCTIATGADGATTMTTVDAVGTSATLELEADGNIILDSAAQVRLDSTTGIRFYEGGTLFGGTEVITGSSIFALYENGGASTDDYFIIFCKNNGATTLQTVDAAGDDAHLNIEPDGHVEFDGCGVGFDLVTPTYNATNTDVDFTTGNKQFLTFGSGNIANLKLKFPATSGNFTLLLKQDGTGSRTVSNWKVYDSAGDDASGSSATKFAGGSNPTLTTDANHVDIVSFFWDSDNEIAYGVASLDFQF